MSTIMRENAAVATLAHPRARSPDAAACVAASLEAALRARTPGTQASASLVRQLASRLGRELELDADARALLDVAVRVRDVGMIALPDSVVLATSPLSPADWELVNRHPVLGQELLEELDSVADAAGVVRAHHERWDGGGYPDALSGASIPLLSRVIATCDTFVAIASDRPYRRGLSAEAALEMVCNESGAQFDPATVDALSAALVNGTTARPRARKRAAGDPPEVAHAANGSHGLKRAIAEFDVVPAMAPAHERILEAVADERTLGGDLVSTIERDTGLTVAVLRAAQGLGGKRPITNVADAVVALGSAGVDSAVREVPRAEFPWRTSELQVLMHHSLVHTQAVARAADRIARELRLPDRDEILAVALLHDIGKLALGRGIPGYPSAAERAMTPEDRVRSERRTWGVDHAGLGGALLRRWGLPGRLAQAVSGHHVAEAENDIATYVRLADMVAHYAQGEPVDRAEMLALSNLCALAPPTLRQILFDLPHSGGSHRRRAEPSPLSKREAAIVRLLAEGKHYKQIALELTIATSTVRTHLHNVYAKFGVDDRAQAVLRATEMGWI